MSRPLPDAPAQLAALLADGIRFERGGVASRARECFEEVVGARDAAPAAAAEALWRIGNLHRLHSEWEAAIAASRAAADLARLHGLANIEADALNIEGVVRLTRNEHDAARVLFRRMLAIADAPATRGKALQNLGSVAAEEGRFVDAQRYFAESRAAFRDADDLRGEAVSLLNIGRLLGEQGDAEAARATLDDASRAARQSGDLELHAAALLNLGIVLGTLGELVDAEERITTAYGQFTIHDIAVQRVRCLLELATLARRRRELESAHICLTHARDVALAAELPREVRLIDERLAEIDGARAAP